MSRYAEENNSTFFITNIHFLLGLPYREVTNQMCGLLVQEKIYFTKKQKIT
jgi:hypothetical protein